MNISSIFSARSISLLVFILVVLFLGAAFDVKVGPESFDGLEHPVETSRPEKKESLVSAPNPTSAN
jgi:hypothetical protein